MRLIALSCLLLGLAAGTARANAPTQPQASVPEDFTFRVCVVDEAQPQDSPERAALRAQIVRSFQETIGAGWRVVRDEKVETKVAIKRMKAGACDAVIFFGEKRPRKMRRLDVVTFGVDLGPKRLYEPVYLIVPAAEVQLQKTILARFPKSLSPLHPPRVLWAGQ